jgi:hypothetical protein
VFSGRAWLVAAVVGFAIGGTAESATADVVGQSMTASAAPTGQSPSVFSGASLNLGWSTAYDESPIAFFPSLREAVLHLDNDFAFDTTGLAQCQLSSIQGKFHAQAVAACPNAVVGSGSAIINAGAVTGIIDVFNGAPSGGSPFVYVNFDIASGATTLTMPGTFSPSSRGGDFGTQLDLATFPNTPGLAFTQINLSFANREPSPGHHFVSARCEADQHWEFAGDFTFYSGLPTTASTSQPCTATPTGARAKALRKCRKVKKRTKEQKRARRRCMKRAKKLPA